MNAIELSGVDKTFGKVRALADLTLDVRAGELTAVWVPDEAHEAVRDLIRARQAAVEDLRRRRRAISSMMSDGCA